MTSRKKSLESGSFVANLSIPDIDLSKMNSDQKFAFDIVLKCIYNYIENPDEFEPLRMIYMHFHTVKMYKDKEVTNVKNFFVNV